MSADVDPHAPTDRDPDGRAGLPEHVTMPLLTLITQQSLDEDYRHVADRKAARTGAEAAEGGAEPSRARRRRGTAVAVALFGLLVTVAAVQTARTADSAATSHAALVEEVMRSNDEVAAAQARLRELREDNVAAGSRLDALVVEQAAATQRAQGVRVATGYLPVAGPGVRAVVDDGESTDDSARVRDEDLAILVDGLWSAGAEAISINGQRLTALSPIRTSGGAIHVANRPVNPPYVVQAIGDTGTLQSRFADSTHGIIWLSLWHAFGFEFEMRNAERLELPGARLPRLREAEAADIDSGKGEPGP